MHLQLYLSEWWKENTLLIIKKTHQGKESPDEI